MERGHRRALGCVGRGKRSGVAVLASTALLASCVAGSIEREAAGPARDVTSTDVTSAEAAPPTDAVPSIDVAPSTDAASPSSMPATTTTEPVNVQFFAGFDRDERDRFDWRLQTTSEPPQRTFLGEHDMGCAGPDTYRDVEQMPLEWGVPHSNVDASASEAVWWCAPGNDISKGHMMTAVDTDSIASLSFSPKQSFTNVSRVCWDQNMNSGLGEGKWLNVFIVPAADVAAQGGDLAYLAGSGLSFGGIPHMLPPGAVDFTWLRGSISSNKIASDGSYREEFSVWMSIDPTDTNGNGAIDPDDDPTQGMATSSAPRFTICVDDGANEVTIERPNGTVDTYPYGISFPTGDVRVIFQDASYNPTKHHGSAQHLTWHWDNITIA